MKLMSDGVQKSAGERLQRALSVITGNRFIALLTGLVVTMIIQSSGATTVMVVTFVNSGLMTLTQSVGVIFGANIGTTITAWIVSLFVANYSFVQLYTEDAQIAIDKLNEYSYRGRKLAVSYSRQKSDEENAAGTESEGFAGDDMSEQEMAREDAAALAAAEKAAADKEPFGV